MELKPVVKLESPAYPTQDELLVDRKTMEAALPERWQKAKGLAGALTLFLAANLSGGCGSEAGNQSVQTSSPSQTKFTWPQPANPSPSLDFAQANQWVKSIYAKNIGMSGGMGFTISITPQGKEDGVRGATQDKQ